MLVYGLFAAVSIQESVRDRLESIPVTGIYYGLGWISMLLAILLLRISLFNATLALNGKGFYDMSFALALFSAITVQKNTRDIQAAQSFVTDPALVQHVPDAGAFTRQDD